MKTEHKIYKYLAIISTVGLLQLNIALAQSADITPGPAAEGAIPVVDSQPVQLAEEPQTLPEPQPVDENSGSSDIPIESPAAPAEQSGSAELPAVDGSADLAVVDSSTPAQDAGSPQTTIESTDLIGTFDPSGATSTESELVEVASSTTSTVAEGETATSTAAQDIVTTSPAPEDASAASEDAPSASAPPAFAKPESDPANVQEPNVVASLSLEELKPRKEFVLGVVGSSIAAKSKPSWQKDGDGEKDALANPTKTVSQVPTISANPDTGTLTVSGSCSESYYAVMVYRRADDYDKDPASYVINRSYPCENGSYSRTLTDIPLSLQTGTYYLLIAEQGGGGAWKPTSAVIPITITKQ